MSLTELLAGNPTRLKEKGAVIAGGIRRVGRAIAERYTALKVRN
jgi:hypothetical protein